MRLSVVTSLMAGLAVAFAAGPSFAASDATSNPSVGNQAVTSVTTPVASTQTAGIISSAIGRAVGGGGSFAPGGGGFSPGGGGGGGFSPGGGGGGSAPGGPSGASGPQSFDTRQMGKAAGAEARNWGVWSQGTASYIDKTETALNMNGEIYTAVVGLDYRLTDRVLLGLAAGYEHVYMNTKFNLGSLKEDGFAIAPYLGVALTPNWSWDISGGYVDLSYDVSRKNGVNTGTYDGSRWFGSTNFTGNYALDNWRFGPKVGVLYLKEFDNSYNEAGAGGVFASASRTQFGRATAGSKVGYALGGVVPYVKLMGEWDFKQPAAVLKSNGQKSNVDEGGGVAGVGADFFSGPLSGTVEGSYNSLFRSDIDNWQGVVRLRYQF